MILCYFYVSSVGFILSSMIWFCLGVQDWNRLNISKIRISNISTIRISNSCCHFILLGRIRIGENRGSQLRRCSSGHRLRKGGSIRDHSAYGECHSLQRFWGHECHMIRRSGGRTCVLSVILFGFARWLLACAKCVYVLNRRQFLITGIRCCVRISNMR